MLLRSSHGWVDGWDRAFGGGYEEGCCGVSSKGNICGGVYCDQSSQQVAMIGIVYQEVHRVGRVGSCLCSREYQH